MSYYRIPSGSNLILNVLLDDGNTGKFPQAHIFKDDFTEVVGSPVPLTPVSYGLYSNLSVSVPDGKYIVVYIVYDDFAHTAPSLRYSRTMDVFDVNDIINVNAISEGVWRETRAGNSPVGSFGEILDTKLSLIKAETALLPVTKTNTDTLVARLTSGRASNLDYLNMPISSLPTAAQLADAVWDENVSGHSIAGTFGARLDVSVGSRESEVTAGIRFSTLIDEHDETRTTLSGISSDLTATKAKTDQLTFTGSNVNANAQVVSDKTGYALSGTQVASLADAIWDEPMAGHLTAGTTGEKLNNGDSSTDISALADAVWDEARSAHSGAGTFGESLQGVLSVARAGNLDNLDVPVSSRESESSAFARANTNVVEHDVTQAMLGAVQTNLGAPVGASLSADIAAVQSTANTINTKLGTPVISVSSDIGGVQSTVNTIDGETSLILNRLGIPSGADFASDVDVLKLNVAAIKAKTDQFSFTTGFVNANVKTNEDKSGYGLANAQVDYIVDKIWDETASGHSIAGTFGMLIQNTSLGVNPVAIAGAVWDESVSSHAIVGSFGELVAVIDHTTQHTLADLTDGSVGLGALKAETINQGGLTRAEVNQNETKIDAIIPAIASAQAAVIAQVDQNETKIDAITPVVIASRDTVVAEVNQNEVKIDALQSSVSSLSNNTTVRFIVPERMIRPSVGTKNYQFHLRLSDENGAPNAPDSTPTIRVRRLDTGVDVISAAAMTQDGAKVGAYFFDYTLLTSTFLAPVLVEVTVVDGGVTNYIPATSEITEFESDLTAVQAQLTVVEGKVDAIDSDVTSGVYGLAAIRTKQDNIVSEINANETKLDSIAAAVSLLPADAATSTEVGAVLSAVNSKPSLSAITGVVNAARDNIKGPDGRNITEVYDNMDLSLVMKTNDPRLNNLDAPISSRSTITVAQVWNHATRTLSQYGLETSNIKAIWDYLAADATTSGSLGKRLADYLDATVSSRATASQVSSELSGVAQESTVAALPSLITTEANENQVLLGQLISMLTSVGVKTANLPTDPASQSAVLGAVAGLAGVLSDISLRTTVIKTKTDNLPSDPAKESTVGAIPTNPLRTTDVRLNTLANLDAPVSSVVPADISNLATKADVSGGNASIENKIDTANASLGELQLKTNAIETKVNRIPVQPAAIQDVNAARDVIMGELLARGPELTSSDVWSHPVREITNDLSAVGPDISHLAEKEDLLPLAKVQFVNRMTTAFNTSTGEQEVLIWAEKDGAAVSGTTASIVVTDNTGAMVWNANALAPNSDGVYRFSHQWQPLAGRNYYIKISIMVDGVLRVNKQSFYT